MVRNILISFSILCSVLLMQNCVHGDLDDCPPMVRYAVAFEYTNHTGNTDRFYDDVKVINLYVFDEENLVYTTKTALSPYETNFNIPLEELPMGNYHIIAWGNVLNGQPFTIAPDTFIRGETTMAEARLRLQRAADNLSQKDMEKLFYGEKQVSIPLYVSRIDTVPLINDTKWIRVVIHWDPTEEIKEDLGGVLDYNDVKVHFDASNGVSNFQNQFNPLFHSISDYTVDYNPYLSYPVKSTGDLREHEIVASYLPRDFENYVIPAAGWDTTVYDLCVLRMMPNLPLKLEIIRKKKVVELSATIFKEDIIPPLMARLDYLASRGDIDEKANKQDYFDKYDFYRIDLYFTYDKIPGEYVTGDFQVEGWHVVHQPTIPGAN